MWMCGCQAKVKSKIQIISNAARDQRRAIMPCVRPPRARRTLRTNARAHRVHNPHTRTLKYVVWYERERERVSDDVIWIVQQQTASRAKTEQKQNHQQGVSSVCMHKLYTCRMSICMYVCGIAESLLRSFAFRCLFLLVLLRHQLHQSIRTHPIRHYRIIYHTNIVSAI